MVIYDDTYQIKVSNVAKASDKIKVFKMSVIVLLFYASTFLPSILGSCFEPGLLFAVNHLSFTYIRQQPNLSILGPNFA